MLTASQLALRKKCITATDVVALAGLNPWKKPIDVFKDKRSDLFPTDETSEKTEQEIERAEKSLTGQIVESAIAKNYVSRCPPEEGEWRIFQPTITLVHPKIPWAAATPDRFVFLQKRGEHVSRADMPKKAFAGQASHMLECKAVGEKVSDHWITDLGLDMPDMDRIPSYVLPQVQWQMFVAEYKRCDVAALINSTTFRVFRIDYDAEYVDALFKIAEDFRNKHILPGIAPDPDGSENYSKYLKGRYKTSTTVTLESTDEMERYARQYDFFRSQEQQAKLNKDGCAQKLQTLMQEAGAIKGYWGKTTWLEQAGKINYGKVAEDLRLSDEFLNKYRTPQRVFNVRLNKKGE